MTATCDFAVPVRYRRGMPTGPADEPAPREADRRLAADVAERMLAATGPEDRWAAIQRTLTELGATAVNAAVICEREERPFWFRSTLAEGTVDAYVRDGFLASDFIVKHAARSRLPLRWRTLDRIGYEADPEHRGFAGFVRDSGERSIVCLSATGWPGSGAGTITYCSTLDPAEAMDSGNLHRVETAIRLLLPWLDWPEDLQGADLLAIRDPELSVREAQALRLLAGGMMNARIADAMGIGEAMVAKHLRAARRKLGAKTREEAVAKAVRAARIGP